MKIHKNRQKHIHTHVYVCVWREALTSNFPPTFQNDKTCLSIAFWYNNQHFTSISQSISFLFFLFIFLPHSLLMADVFFQPLYFTEKFYFQQNHPPIDTTFSADIVLLTSTLYDHHNV